MVRQKCKVSICRHMTMGEQPCEKGCIESKEFRAGMDSLEEVRNIPVQAEFLKPDKGLRYNAGKLRYDLLHPVAQDGIVRVLTKGAEKYAERNWEKGMKWTTILASMKRHIAAIERGEDYDPETGELHIDHVQCNAHFLSAYYKIYPQGDDRVHSYLHTPKIGLDIDEVLCDWVGGWCDYKKIDRPKNWFFQYDIKKDFDKLHSLDELNNFYLSLPCKIKAESLPFEPHCYITSRPVDSQITMQWLISKGFPAKPVYTTTESLSKVDIAKRENLDIFVDDNWDNFVELNKAGVCCFLMDNPHNHRYDAGFKRIKELKEIL